MKKLIIAVVTLCSLNLGLKAQQEGKSIIFFKGTLSETLSAAQKANKLVFIDCYTSWCAPCKMMDKYLFTNDTVAQYFNKNFINYKLDMEKGEGPEVGKKYTVFSYPTYLFLDGTGKLVHRSAGRKPAAEFIAVAKQASNPAETSLAMVNRYAAGERSPDFLLKYVVSLNGTNSNKAKRIFQENLTTVSDEVLKTDLGWEIIKMYPLSEEDRLYKFLTANEAHFISKYGKSEVKKIQRAIEVKVLYATLHKMESEKFFRLLATYRQNTDAEAVATAAKMELIYYLNAKDYPTFIKLAKQYSQSSLKTEDATLNFLARRCADSTEDKAALQQALAMAKQAVAINDKDYANQSSYAQVCYKMGLKDEALNAAQIAYQIIKDENPKAAKKTEELIAKIKVM